MRLTLHSPSLKMAPRISSRISVHDKIYCDHFTHHEPLPALAIAQLTAAKRAIIIYAGMVIVAKTLAHSSQRDLSETWPFPRERRPLQQELQNSLAQ